MKAAVESTRRTLAGLQVGRAHPDLLDRIRVQAYDALHPLSSLAQVGVQQPRGLVITPHDPHVLGAIERALQASDLGVQPSNDGTRIRIELPPPSSERRHELARTARATAEQGRVAVRSARHAALHELRRQRASDRISEAQLRGRSKRLQPLTDDHVAQINALLANTLAALEL